MSQILKPTFVKFTAFGIQTIELQVTILTTELLRSVAICTSRELDFVLSRDETEIPSRLVIIETRFGHVSGDKSVTNITGSPYPTIFTSAVSEYNKGFVFYNVWLDSIRWILRAIK